MKALLVREIAPNKALVRTQTTLRSVCAAQLGRYMSPLILFKSCCGLGILIENLALVSVHFSGNFSAVIMV